MSTNKPAEFNFYLNTQGPRGRQGAQGPQGVSPTITIGQNNANSFTLVITDANGTFETPNLKGNLIDVSDNGSYVRYQPSDGTLYTSDLEQATSSTLGGVRFATEDNLIDDISSGVVISPSDLQDYLAAKLTAGDNITITKDNETGVVTISATGGGSGGVSSYNNLEDKPSLYGIKIEGDNTLSHYVPMKPPLKETVGVDYEQDIVVNNGTLENGFLTFLDDWNPQFGGSDNAFNLQGEYELNGDEFTPNSYASMPISLGDIIGFPSTTGADIACGHIRTSDNQFVFTHLLRVDGLGAGINTSTQNTNINITNKVSNSSTLNCTYESGSSTLLTGKNITNNMCYFQFRQDGEGNYVVIFLGQNEDGQTYGLKTTFNSESAKANLAQLSRVFYGGTDVLQNPQDKFAIYRNPNINLEDITSQADFDGLTNMVNWQFPDAEHNLYVDYDNNTIKVNDNGQLYADIDVSDYQSKFAPNTPLQFTTQTTANYKGVVLSSDTYTIPSRPTYGVQGVIGGSSSTTYPTYIVSDGVIDSSGYVSFPFVPNRYYFSVGAHSASGAQAAPNVPFAMIGTFDTANPTHFRPKYIIGMTNLGKVAISDITQHPLVSNEDWNLNQAKSDTISGGIKTSNTTKKAMYGFCVSNIGGKLALQFLYTETNRSPNYGIYPENSLYTTSITYDLTENDVVYMCTSGYDSETSGYPVNTIGYLDSNNEYFNRNNLNEKISQVIPVTFEQTSEQRLKLNYDNGTIKINGQGQLYANIPDPYVLPTATTAILGGVKPDGTTITVTADGTISAVQADPYTLPAATTTSLGGVKPDGTTITVTSDGTITAVGGGTGGTMDYTALTNKPQINSVELTGNKTLVDIGAQAITDNTLTTTDKTIVGAINELVMRIAALETKVTSLNSVIDGQTGGNADA